MFRNKLPVKNTNAKVLPRPMESEFPEVISRHPHFKTPKVILKYPRDEDQCATGKFNLYKSSSLTSQTQKFCSCQASLHPCFPPKRKWIYVFIHLLPTSPIWNTVHAPYCLFKSSPLPKLGSSFTSLLTHMHSTSINKLQSMCFPLCLISLWKQ